MDLIALRCRAKAQDKRGRTRKRRREMRFVFFNAPRGTLWQIVGHGCGSMMIIKSLTRAIELSEHHELSRSC